MGKNRSLSPKTSGEFSPWVRQDDEADGAYWEVRAVRFFASKKAPAFSRWYSPAAGRSDQKKRDGSAFVNNGTVRARALTHTRENPEVGIKKIGILKKPSEKEIRLSPERIEQGVDIG